MHSMSPNPSQLTPKGRATRERILRAASAHMREYGVAATSTEDVQEAAGVSASQLYHYFRNKGELISAVVVYQTEMMLADQQSCVDQLDSLSALRTWRDYVVESQRAHDFTGGCPLGSFTSQVAERWPAARAEVANGFRRWENALRSGLQAMKDRGELAPDAQPDRLALMALVTVQGGIVLTQANRNTEALEAALDEFLAHVESFVVR